MQGLEELDRVIIGPSSSKLGDSEPWPRKEECGGRERKELSRVQGKKSSGRMTDPTGQIPIRTRSSGSRIFPHPLSSGATLWGRIGSATTAGRRIKEGAGCAIGVQV